MYKVYKATNLKTGRCYIGFTRRELEARAYYHYVYAETRAKFSKFAAALNEFSRNDWTWEIVATANSEEQAKTLEIFYISKYDSYVSGYNGTIGGIGSNGRSLSEETRNKISEANKGREASEETRKKLSDAGKGRKLTDQDKENKSKAARNRVYRSESGYKGVQPIKKKGEIVKWKVIFCISRRNIVNLGNFITLDEAIEARKQAEKEFENTGTVQDLKHKAGK